MNITIFEFIPWLRKISASSNKTKQTILRILTAVFGGFGLTYSALAALALLLPWPRVDVVFFSALFPGILWLGALLWAFAAPTAQRACRDLFGAAALLGILALAAFRTH